MEKRVLASEFYTQGVCVYDFGRKFCAVAFLVNFKFKIFI